MTGTTEGLFAEDFAVKKRCLQQAAETEADPDWVAIDDDGQTVRICLLGRVHTVVFAQPIRCRYSQRFHCCFWGYAEAQAELCYD